MRTARFALFAVTALAALGAARPAHAGEWFWNLVTFWRQGDAPLTQPVARRAIREALTLSSDKALRKLAQPGGFVRGAGAALALPLPEQLADAQATLREVGRSGELDDLQLRLNRAAEVGVGALRPALAKEIDALVISDALSLTRGPPDAATRLLRQRAEGRLVAVLTPVMSRALAEAGAMDVVEDGARAARAPGRAEEWRQRLTDYATRAAIEQFFTTMASEEAALRATAARQMSEDLRRAFSGD